MIQVPNSATSVWKTFDENVVTHSSAHHLTAIHELLRRYGYARVTDVAKHLGITRGSASVTLKALKEKGYATEDDNKFLRLTASGEQIVQTIEANREVLQKFFLDVLAVNHEQAEIDACKLEHLLSSEIGKRLLNFLDFLFSEDHRAAAFLAAFQSIKQANSECPEYPKPFEETERGNAKALHSGSVKSPFTSDEA